MVAGNLHGSDHEIAQSPKWFFLGWAYICDDYRICDAAKTTFWLVVLSISPRYGVLDYRILFGFNCNRTHDSALRNLS